MPELISKIQYNTCEKGEFFDEQPRSLEDTLKLIRSFPWDQQRGSDIQLSGPGIVIQNSHGEYLKVALYFNGKYSCYFLDKGNHLYEYHTPELLEECKLVKDFFIEALELSAFDKHFFTIGNRSHFTTQDFIYRVNRPKEYLRMIGATSFVLLELGMFFISLFLANFPLVVSILFFCIVFIFGAATIMVIKVFLRTKEMAIKISKNKNEFGFNDGNGWIEYLKSDIADINIYGNLYGRGRQVLTILQFRFKNGSTIKFSGMLIDPGDAMMKIPDDIPRNYFEQSAFLRKSVWQY